ncbi:MAG: VOC family protein [Synergistaceae bacterium]|nr:VOC family protein [Synergistaceae bacterium]
MRINHVGYAVQDIEAAAASFLSLGHYICGTETEDRKQGVKILFISDPSGAKIELIAPLDENSPVSGWLRKNGNSLYHVCYESNDLAADIAELRKKGFITVDSPSPAPAMEGRRVVFLYGKHTGLIELAETDKNDCQGDG